MACMKVCFKCEQEKPVSEFYRHKMMADGHLNKCKECAKRDVRTHRAKSDSVREYDRRRGNRQPPGYIKAYRKQNPKKYAAHTAVANAIRDGRLQRQSCEVCGDTNTHGHHDDYSKPLDVRWLCPRHHRLHHAAWHEETQAQHC